MASRGVASVVQFLRSLACKGAEGVSDRLLVQRFAAGHDEEAFATLVQRHGLMVWGVCRRLLPHTADAEDAFQATFLVFARRAASIAKPHLLANWLYGVAYRTALEARGRVTKHRAAIRPLPDVPAPEPRPDVVWSDLRPVLDAEVNGLPEKYRVPFVLCYLEGMTNEAAARTLGCPPGTIMSRLAWARERLRRRLTRRGLALPAGLLAATLNLNAASAVVPAPLTLATVKAVGRFGAGQVGVAASVAALVEGVQRAMSLARVKAVALVLLTVTVAAAGGVLFVGGTPAVEQPQPGANAAPGTPPAPRATPPSPREQVVRGENYVVAPVTTDLQRAILGSRRPAVKSAKAYVLVDGMSVLRPDGTADAKALDFGGLRKALLPYRGEGHGVFVNVTFGSGAPEPGASVVRWALEGFARQTGFGNVGATSTYFNGTYDWKGRVERASTGKAAATDAKEPPVGNNLVTVYPVRTTLSRWLTDGADCVVDLLQPLDGRAGGGPGPDVQEAIRRSVARLQLPRQHHVYFRIPAGPDAVRHFAQDIAEPLAKSLGFAASSVGGR